MDGVADRPKWLLELENRKRKPRLAHEAGAGAPCMICNSACPGLDLHFWRKICKNCKCSRDDHDVEDDEFPQFDLLFGPSGKFKKRSMLLRVNDKKQKDAETTFEWVPPDTTEELATDYMNSLPMEKLPIKGSTGAVLRRQLLQKQMPLHDIDHKMCDGLTEDEKKQFEKYLENLKRYVGQGKVIKILGARPFDRSLMTPINATDMQRCSPQHKPKILSSVQLRTPSSFTAKINTRSPYVKSACETSANHETSNNTEPAENNFNSNPKQHDPIVSTILDKTVLTSVPVQGGTYNNPIHSNSNLAKLDNSSRQIPTTTTATTAPGLLCSPATTHHIGDKAPFSKCSKMSQDKSLHGGNCECSPLPNVGVSSQQQLPPDLTALSSQVPLIQNYQEILTNPVYCLAQSEELNNKDVLTAESMLADALLPPSAIHANDIIGSTLDKEGLSYIREKLTNKYSVQEDPILRNQPEMSQDLGKKSLVGKYNRMDVGNESIKDTDWKKSIPIAKNSLGLENKDAQIIDNIGSFGGSTSGQTKRQICGESPAVLQSSSIHPIHCNNIGEKYNQSSICQPPVPQFSSNLKTRNEPRSTPSEPIAHLKIPNNCVDNTLLEPSCSSQLLPGNLQSDCFHSKVNSIHPVPSNIIYSESLQNQIFPHDAVGSAHQLVQNLPNVDHLKQDMEGLKVQSTKVQKCNKCQDDIHIGDVVVTVEKAKNESWHPGCFVCSVCNELLADLVYFYYKKKLYCGRDLAKLLGIPRCFACDELVFVREYTVAEGHNYHVKHFCCWDCDVPLAGQQYISENDRPLCLPCYQKTYAKTCSTCNVIIAADQQGVEIKNLNFHATETCFCCYTCKKSLLSGKMAIKEDRPFCSKECITTFLSSK